jgi:restriction system protein
MGRRRDDGFSALMTYASKLTWKLGVGLALIAFVALHLIAQQSRPTSGITDLQALGAVVLRQYVHAFATLLQFIVPAGFLTGAAVSFIKHARSKELIDSVRAPSGREVSSLSWQEFERLVGEGFRQRGFQVTERGRAGPDGGVDLALARGHERFLVQCKQWRAQQVGVSVVRELYGVMAAERVAGGYVVTSGSFTKDAKEFSAGRNIELIDGKGLSALLRDGQSAIRPIESTPEMPPVGPKAPSCPKCRSPMVLRTAKRGAHIGRSFWGCPQYPKCQAIVARQ